MSFEVSWSSAQVSKCQSLLEQTACAGHQNVLHTAPATDMCRKPYSNNLLRVKAVIHGNSWAQNTTYSFEEHRVAEHPLGPARGQALPRSELSFVWAPCQTGSHIVRSAYGRFPGHMLEFTGFLGSGCSQIC